MCDCRRQCVTSIVLNEYRRHRHRHRHRYRQQQHQLQQHQLQRQRRLRGWLAVGPTTKVRQAAATTEVTVAGIAARHLAPTRLDHLGPRAV